MILKPALENILRFDLPCFWSEEEGMYNPCEDKPELQHPYSRFEIYAFDSCCMFMISDDEELISRFKKCYPKYEED